MSSKRRDCAARVNERVRPVPAPPVPAPGARAGIVKAELS
jgi:hypothetical protein